MDNGQTQRSKKLKEKYPDLNKRKGARYSAKFKADLVKTLNRLWGDGAEMKSACEAANITHNTYWVWRNETEELREHFEKENERRHKVRAERLKLAAYFALEFLLTPEKRERSIKEDKPDRNGNFKVTKIVRFEEFRDPTPAMVLKALEVYASDEFDREVEDRTYRVIFTDDAGKTDLEPTPEEGE